MQMQQLIQQQQQQFGTADTLAAKRFKTDSDQPLEEQPQEHQHGESKKPRIHQNHKPTNYQIQLQCHHIKPPLHRTNDTRQPT
jgi:hypothetical protein